MVFVEERGRLTLITFISDTPLRLAHSNERGVAAAVVQLTSSTLSISGRFNASRSTRCFFMCLRAQDRARKKLSVPFFSEITSSLSLVTLAMEVPHFAFVLQCSWQADFFSREVIHAMSVNTTPACRTARINQETSGYEQGGVPKLPLWTLPLHIMYALLTTTYAGCFL